MSDLTDSAIRSAKPKSKIYRLSDMGGLYLEVLPSGRKTFRVQYRLAGKQLTYSIGEWPAVGLMAARSRAVDVRMMVKAGRDPKGPSPAADGSDTFRSVARAWYEGNAKGWKDSHASRVWSRVDRFLMPALGDRSIRQITPKELLDVLKAIESADTCKRVREYAGQIWTYGIASDRAETNPATGLSKALPRPPRQKHFPALTHDELPEFFRKLGESRMDQRAALCLRLLAHTAVRPGELMGGRWAEVNGDRWIVPADRTKMERDLIVPLSPTAQNILTQLKAISGGDEHFASLTPDKLGKALNKLLGQGKAVPHGFRSTFSTISNDSGLWNPDAIERQLGHAPRNAIRAAYNRALHLPERIRLMHWYSDILDEAQRRGDKGDLSDLLN